MDTLPVELHAQIFHLACTDDGTTARSLSLVSRYVHQVAEPLLYHTLNLSGYSQLGIIANKLPTLPIKCRRVHHLFISDHTTQQNALHDILNYPDFDSETSPIIRILNITLQSLVSLSLDIANPRISPHLLGHIFSFTFPRLRTLLIHGFYPIPHTPQSLPRLEYLHLSGHRNPHGLLQTGGLAAACPNLTRIKISGLMFARSFVKELEDALLLESRDAPSGAPISPLLPHLQHISIAPAYRPAPKLRRRCFVSGVQDDTYETLKELEGRADSEKSTVGFEVGEMRNAQELSSALVSEWLNEIN